MAARGADETALRKVFSQLVDGLKAVDVIDDLFQEELLTRDEYKGVLDACPVSSTDDSKAVNRRVLVAIAGRPPGFAAKLVEILSKKYRSLAAALENGELRCAPSLPPDSRGARPRGRGDFICLCALIVTRPSKPALSSLLVILSFSSSCSPG